MFLLNLARAAWRYVPRVYDLVHNGQDDTEALYPDAFHPTGAEAALQGSVTTFIINSARGA